MNKKYFIYSLLMICAMTNSHFCSATTQYVLKAAGHSRTQAPSGTFLLVVPKNPIKPIDIALVTGVTGGGAAVGYSFYRLNSQSKTSNPRTAADESGYLGISSEDWKVIGAGVAAAVIVAVAAKTTSDIVRRQ